MQTKVQNMQNYVGYIKCGEILKPPIESYQRPYVLKCFHCKEIYLLFEAFIFHIEDHCKNLIAQVKEPEDTSAITQTTEATNNEEQVVLSDRIDINVKVEENIFPMQTEDPLIVVKPEDKFEEYNDDESSSFKEELKPPDHKLANSDNDEEESNSTTVEELCATDDLTRILDVNDEMEYLSSDEEVEISSNDSLSSDDEDIYDIRIVKKRKGTWDGSKSQSAFVNKFLETKIHVVALIDAYKNQPSLWNKNFPFLRHKSKRQNCLQKIADDLHEKHNLLLTWNQVANVVVYLCRKYREDLKGVKESKEGKEKYIPSWFFENLNFLKPFMENNQIAKLDSHLPDLSPNQIIEILEIYKGLPYLWNTQLIEHYCKNKIYAAKQEMLQMIEAKVGLKITEHILDDYFRTINNCFARAKRKKEDKKPNDTNTDTNIEESTQKDYYENMLFLYDHVGSFKCVECKRSFKNPLCLKIHQTQFHGSEPLSCSLCGKQFKTVNAFTNHAKRHMKDLNHECKECGKKFLHSTELRIHMRNHTGVKPFCCEICGASFRHIQGFSNHHRRHIKNYLHTCQICSKGFYSKDRYNDHMNAHSNIRSQVCNVCGKTFITKRSLQQHVVIHDDIRRHACKLCGKTFKHKTGVNQHMKTHGVANSEEKSKQ